MALVIQDVLLADLADLTSDINRINDGSEDPITVPRRNGTEELVVNVTDDPSGEARLWTQRGYSSYWMAGGYPRGDLWNEDVVYPV